MVIPQRLRLQLWRRLLLRQPLPLPLLLSLQQLTL
jgi:hypothetical protein